VWKRGGLGSFALVSCAVALLLGGLSGSAQATFPGARGTIVFIDLHNRLDTINTDGTGLAVLRGESFYAQPEGPAWSPDGRYVTWAQAPDRDVGPHLKDIGVINVETGDWHWLTTTGRELVGDSFAPAWSHWGYITFTYRRYDNRDGPADGTYQTYLDGTRPTLYKAGPEMRAAPVPFGRRALFAFIRDGALYVSDETNGTLDGTQVADGPIWDFDWSPDGRRIAYTTGPPYTSTDWHIWIVDADGTNAQELATGFSPGWSPDGAKIVFSTVEGLAIIDSSRRTGLRHIVNPATGQIVHGWSPDWQPVHPTAPSEPLSADVGVTATSEPTELRVGEQVTYTATVTNHGPAAAVDVVLSVDLPDGLRSVGVSSTAGSCSSIRPVACRLGTMTRAETATVTMKATAAAAGTSTVTFAVGESVLDPNVADNNRVTVSTHVSPVPAVSATPCTIRGTEGGDTLVGTPGRDVICGLDGDDTIRGLGGDDLVFGGRGADRIFGGAGADRLYGGGDDDVLEGDSGRDLLSGERGKDSLRARDRARDSVFGGPGRDQAVADRVLDRVRGVESVARG
jgi:uncharacterized repeat protein (TIGR01451 family)